MNNKIKNLIPSRKAAIRASFALIPYVGGALDHLLFDKADEIRLNNIELAIKTIDGKLNKIKENHLDKDWFESTEALQLFRQLVEKVQFEPKKEKVALLSDLYVISGKKDLSKDPNKFVVLHLLSQLTIMQKDILFIVKDVKPEIREEGKFIITSSKAIWFDSIKKAIEDKWNMPVKENYVYTELGVLSSLGLLSERRTLQEFKLGYEMTVVGQMVNRYLEEVSKS